MIENRVLKDRTRAYAFDGRGGGAVLENDTELGELGVDLEQVG